MKAVLKLVNIGQREGEETWEFNSGVVTEIRGRTASGKSRILKSCALALSIPINSEEIRNTAISFGIAKADNAIFSPLLNYNKEKANIELHYDDVKKFIELNRDGSEKINIPGNQKFIYCSMLVENSKIQNYIDHGLSDFSWIVTEMSLAKDYESIEDIVGSYSDLITAKKEEIETKENNKKKFEGELKKNKTELEEVIKKIGQLEVNIEKELEKIESNTEMKKKRKEIIEEIKDKQRLNSDTEKKFLSLKKTVNDLDKKIKENKNTIEDETKNMDKLEQEKNDYMKIDMSKLNNEINQLHEENEKNFEKQKLLLPEISILENHEKKYEGILRELDKTKETKVICWVCGGKEIDRNDIENDLKSTQDELTPYRKNYRDLETQIEDNKEIINIKQKEKAKKANLPDVKKKIELLRSKLIELAEENSSKEEQKNKEDMEVKKFTKIIESRKKTINQLVEKRNELEKQIIDDTQINKTREETKKQNTKKGAIENQISNLELNIDDCKSIEILKQEFDLLKAKKIVQEFDEIFTTINSHLEKNIKEQREGAAHKFNKNIEKIIEELKLPKFEKIYLDIEDNNKLKIIRKGNPNPQAINSLSAGERVIVSSLLQISAKETYNPEIPFIVGDDIILKMDNERREIFYNYLKNIAKENDWFVILTRVTDEDLIKEEI
ncbi:MAG: hypothetical protein CEE43_06070 [Promethearchaeota archaeon Loki_b32]|nr:MAG: hypothetical protein CEE43_06070 [Candidatus Lokiarchaeota archaeon Loki_b32]